MRVKVDHLEHHHQLPLVRPVTRRRTDLTHRGHALKHTDPCRSSGCRQTCSKLTPSQATGPPHHPTTLPSTMVGMKQYPASESDDADDATTGKLHLTAATETSSLYDLPRFSVLRSLLVVFLQSFTVSCLALLRPTPALFVSVMLCVPCFSSSLLRRLRCPAAAGTFDSLMLLGLTHLRERAAAVSPNEAEWRVPFPNVPVEQRAEWMLNLCSVVTGEGAGLTEIQ
ncbi:hypothetical protein O3P69_011492 [Scylla paramamosain]|uniref:Uncharacterized protein n=1 Tax=Scylla paramamosain TaxID=85552 RepID=A0AAW0T6X7_SCYPA